MPQLRFTPMLFALAVGAFIQIPQCFADTTNLGFISLVPGPNGTAAFNISNNTGTNISPFPDTSFPVVTPVSFTGLTLIVNFADGTAEQFDSYNGEPEPDFATKPISSAILIGTIGATNLQLNDRTTVMVGPSVYALIAAAGPTGVLTSSDFGLIQATLITSVTGRSVAILEPAASPISLSGVHCFSCGLLMSQYLVGPIGLL